MRSTLPTEANQDSEELGLLVERSLTQTAERGGTYAVVPVPWARAWWRLIEQSGEQCFAWWDHCGPNRFQEAGWNFDRDDVTIDGEGNFLVCLMPVAHKGDCGYAWLI